MTSGGNVPIHTEATRAKLKAAWTPERKAKFLPAMWKAAIAANTGSKRSAETCEKIGAVNRGRKRSAESRAKISQAKKGIRLSPESEAKRIASRAGYKHSPETRARISAAISKHWETRT